MYNESDRIERCVSEVKAALERFSKRYEIILAEDGSTDGTDKIAARLAAQDKRIIHLHSNQRMGRGAALKRAIKCASGEVIVYIDADLAMSLDRLQTLIEVARKNCGISTGSRMIKGSVVKRPILRSICSICYNLLVRALFRDGVHDHQCGFKAFTKSMLTNINAADDNWFWDTEIIVRAKKASYQVIEIPITWTEKRRSSESKVKVFHDAKTMGLALLSLWWNMKNKRCGSRQKTVNEEVLKKRLAQKYYDSLAERYDLGDVTYHHVRKEFLQTIHKDYQIVLDVGCGSGKLLKDICSFSNYAVGLDLSKRILKVAQCRIRQEDNCELILGDVEALPFKDEAFDLIACTEVIEHVPSPLIMLQEVVRIMEKEGMLFLTTPNHLWQPIHHLAETLMIKVAEETGTRHMMPWQLRKLLGLAHLYLASSKGTIFAPHMKFERVFELLSTTINALGLQDLCLKQFYICKKVR